VFLGLPLGGFLGRVAGWRATFWVNIPLAVVVTAMAWRWSPRDPNDRSAVGRRLLASDLDAAGIGLFGATLTLFVAFLVPLPTRHWIVLAGSIVCGIGLLWWELRTPDPFIDLRTLIHNRALTSTYLRNAGTMSVAYGVMYGLTQWLQEARGLSATLTGLLVLPMNFAGAVMAHVVSRRNRVRAPLLISAAVAIVVAVALRLVDIDTSAAMIILVTAVAGVVIGVATVGNQSAVFAQAEAREAGTTAGLLRTSTYVSAIASGSVIGVVFRDGATDNGLHAIADILIVVTVLVLALTAVDRRLPHRLQTDTA
ncbi:MFS transporter, partial [Bacillus subtilis]